MTSKLARLGRLTPKQAWSIGRAKTKISIWNGAVSSGKTITSLFKWLMLIPTAPRTGEIVMIGRTRDTVYRNLMTQLQNRDIYGDLADHVHYNRGAPTATILGRTVHILGASDVRAESAIRGMTISLAYLDEATLVAQEFFAMLVSRLRVKGFNCQLLCTTNPDSPRHWLKTEYMDRADDPELSITVFNFRLRDNWRNLERAYIRSLEAQYTGLWRARFIDGEWTMADGVIFDMFDPANMSSRRCRRCRTCCASASTTASTTRPRASSSASVSTTACMRWLSGHHLPAPPRIVRRACVTSRPNTRSRPTTSSTRRRRA
ncbi:hypothetical protein GS904_16630 [Rhodococcus hoagii]|nr:hypothetical protein [Prescottella equi]